MDDALSQQPVAPVADGGDNLGIGPRQRDEFEQSQVARWVEKMRPKKMVPQRVGAPGRDLAHRQSRGVRADNGAWLPVSRDLREHLLFDGQVLDNGFKHPVRLRDPGQMIVEVSGFNQLGPRGDEESRRLRMQGPLFARRGEAVAHLRVFEGQPPAPFVV